MIHDVPMLLDELCVQLRICLEPDDRARLSVAPPRDVESFVNAVLMAEGIDPVTAERRLRNDIRACVTRYEQS